MYFGDHQHEEMNIIIDFFIQLYEKSEQVITDNKKHAFFVF